MNKNQLQIVTNTQAKELYHLGFYWDVDYYYPTVGNDWNIPHRLSTCEPININAMKDNKIAAPTVALALKWFRDILKVFYYVEFTEDTKKTYEELENELLDKLIDEYSLPF